MNERLLNRRIVVTRYGGLDVLEVVEEERRAPKRGEVEVRVLAAGVSLPDVMMREGIHPETPRVPFTPGWDLVGVVERVGEGVAQAREGEVVAALPISGAYTEFLLLPEGELFEVPAGVDAGEAVSLILNYVTAYQMLHRTALRSRKPGPGMRMLVHGAAGGVGTALLQLGRLVGAEMYGTCSARGRATVAELGAVPIDYERQDFVAEMQRLSPPGADVVFDGIGGEHAWRSRKALRAGGRVVAYGLTGSLRGGRLASDPANGRHRFRESAKFLRYVVASWLAPGRKRIVPYSIQWLKRVRPALFREDLTTLFALLKEGKIKPLIAQRFPLADARAAQELLGKGGVVGKIVLVGADA